MLAKVCRKGQQDGRGLSDVPELPISQSGSGLREFLLDGEVQAVPRSILCSQAACAVFLEIQGSQPSR